MGYTLRITLALILSFTLLYSCGPVEETLEDEPDEEEAEEELEIEEDEEEVEILEQPEWYTEIRPYKTEDGYLYTSASAVSSDSSRALRLAEDISVNRMLNGATRVMESLREHIVEDSGRDWDMTSYIELRYQLETEALADISEKTDEKVFFNEEQEHYQAYVRHHIDSDNLVEHISGLLAGKDSLAWITTDYDVSELIAGVLGDELRGDEELEAN